MISIVIPHYPGATGANEALQKCRASIKNHLYDEGFEKYEYIVVENDGEGYAKSVNKGLAQAKGEYLLVSNNDIVVIQGILNHMAHPLHVTVPMIVPLSRDYAPRCFFMMHRWIYEEMKTFYSDGFYDERFYPGYFEDDDMIKRLGMLLIKYETVDAVIVHHLNGGGLTIKQFGEQESFDTNKQRFEEKWQKIKG